jgi:hypothetical protein
MNNLDPAFIEPKVGDSRQTGPQSTSNETKLEIANGNDEPTRVVNFKRQLPTKATAGDRSKFVKAAQTSQLAVGIEAAHSIARALVDPRLGTRMIQAPAFIEEVVETATLRSIQGELLTTELFPLIQPRTAGSALRTPGPQIIGDLDESGLPLASLSLTFRDLGHLRAYMQQTVRETRRVGNRYDESILARRVSRPVFTHAATILFEDSDDEIDVLVVRDGITRVISSYAARMMGTPSTEDIANGIVDTLLSPKSPRAGVASTNTQDYARGREAARDAHRVTFESGLAGAEVGEQSIRIGQTFTLPGMVYVDIIPEKNSPLPAEAQFDEAIRAVVSSIHVEFRGWDETSERVEVGDRALQRIGHSGELLQSVVDLAVGIADKTTLPVAFDNPAIPASDLWRGVYIVAWMCHPTSFKAMKRELRSILGLRRIEDKSYISHLAPLIDRPWRLHKSGSLSQARSAWANGGPIPSGALGRDWDPVPVADFDELVQKALEGEINARLTLQVAGGIALIADKLLTSNKGSKVGTVVPFRSDVDDVVTNLGASEHGLRILARAANAFEASKIAINSLSDTEMKDPALADKRATAYRVPRVDPENLTKLVRDNAGVPEAINEFEIVTVSAPDRAEKAKAESQRQEKAKQKAAAETEVQIAERLRRDVRVGIAKMLDDIQALTTLAANSDGSVVSVFESQSVWQETSNLVSEIQAALYMSKPASVEHDDEDDEEDEDS